ncbi:hypothetical protein HN873_016685 [Arachis hypogaea]
MDGGSTLVDDVRQFFHRFTSPSPDINSHHHTIDPDHNHHDEDDNNDHKNNKFYPCNSIANVNNGDNNLVHVNQSTRL